VFFSRLAEIAGEYLRKGSQVYVEGALRTRKWQGQDGADRYTTEIVANEMQMLGGRGGEASARPAGGGFRDSAPAQPAQQAKAAPQGGGQSSAPAPAPAEDNFAEDDIPF